MTQKSSLNAMSGSSCVRMCMCTLDANCWPCLSTSHLVSGPPLLFSPPLPCCPHPLPTCVFEALHTHRHCHCHCLLSPARLFVAHPRAVLEALNQLPKQQHGVNIMRVKLHLLASQGALYRWVGGWLSVCGGGGTCVLRQRLGEVVGYPVVCFRGRGSSGLFVWATSLGATCCCSRNNSLYVGVIFPCFYASQLFTTPPPTLSRFPQPHRQTIVTSSFASPQLNATFNRHTSSHAGKFRLVTQPTGVLNQVVPQVGGMCGGGGSGVFGGVCGGGWVGCLCGGWGVGECGSMGVSEIQGR